jgi:hypothetical protein
MFKYIHWTYRDLRIWTMNLWNESLNWNYTADFFNSNTFWDYAIWNIVKLDLPINNESYTWVIPIIDDNEQIVWTTKKLTRFVRLKYSDLYTNAIDLTNSIQNSWAINNVSMFNNTIDTINRLKENTNLVEKTPWVFILSNETTWMNWEIIPEQLLTIE